MCSLEASFHLSQEVKLSILWEQLAGSMGRYNRNRHPERTRCLGMIKRRLGQATLLLGHRLRYAV